MSAPRDVLADALDGLLTTYPPAFTEREQRRNRRDREKMADAIIEALGERDWLLAPVQEIIDLARSSEPASTGLDVERLARAIAASEDGFDFGGSVDIDIRREHYGTARELAAEIALHYGDDPARAER